MKKEYRLPGGLVLVLVGTAFAAWLGWAMGIGYFVGGVALALASAWSIYAAIENEVGELGIFAAILFMGLVAMFGLYGLGIFVVSVGGGFLASLSNAID